MAEINVNLTEGAQLQVEIIGSGPPGPPGSVPASAAALEALVKEANNGRLIGIVNGTLAAVADAGGSGFSGLVTPEDYGAVGDGVHDDAPALKAALESGKSVVLTQDLHLFTNIRIEDRDVFWDGQGHTVYLHGAGMEGNALRGGRGGACIRIRAVMHEGVAAGADVVLYTETGTEAMNPAFPEQSSYHRGYISYHGFNPTPTRESYESFVTHSWYEHRADIRNLRFVGQETDGLIFLQLYQMCRSSVDNCEFLADENGGAAIGVQVNNGYSILLTRIRAEGFTARTCRRSISTGYGIQVIGDAITVSDCILKNNKNHVNIGGGTGPAGCFTTGALLENLVLQTRDTGERTTDGSNAAVYQQLLDLHEGCHHPVISNVVMEYENALGTDDWGTLIHLSCPECTVSNVVCHFHQAYGEWAIGYLGFGPLARRVELYNVHARNCYLFAHGWGYERGGAYDANYIREIRMIGGEIGGIHDGDRNVSSGLVKIRLSGVRVGGLVRCAWLSADNCVFRNENQPSNRAQITIEQEAFFTGCDISGYALGPYMRSEPVIKAPANSVYMTGCIVRKPLDVSTFRTEQLHLVNNAEFDLFGLVLGSRTSELYSDGDECALDQFNLW